MLGQVLLLLGAARPDAVGLALALGLRGGGGEAWQVEGRLKREERRTAGGGWPSRNLFSVGNAACCAVTQTSRRETRRRADRFMLRLPLARPQPVPSRPPPWPCPAASPPRWKPRWCWSSWWRLQHVETREAENFHKVSITFAYAATAPVSLRKSRSHPAHLDVCCSAPSPPPCPNHCC